MLWHGTVVWEEFLGHRRQFSLNRIVAVGYWVVHWPVKMAAVWGHVEHSSNGGSALVSVIGYVNGIVTNTPALVTSCLAGWNHRCLPTVCA